MLIKKLESMTDEEVDALKDGFFEELMEFFQEKATAWAVEAGPKRVSRGIVVRVFL